ncbi:MAG TPA: Uma2 family endonuclease [Thermomicrobiales bacterium]
MVIRTVLQADDLLQLPDDGQRRELIAGELRTMSPSGEEHGGLAAMFTTYLNSYVLAHRLGRVFAAETGFLIATDPDTVRAPDVAFVRSEQMRAVGAGTGYRRGAPDLAVEIVSPHDRYTEVEEKVAAWLTHGTRMVVVVNPRRQSLAVHHSATDVRHLTIDDSLDGEDVIPGWSLPLRDLFQ